MPARQPRPPFRFTFKSDKIVYNPTFPEDLEREIFLIAAESSQQRAAGLTRVARRVHIWITPVLYRILTFNDIQTCLWAQSFFFKGYLTREIHSTADITILHALHNFPNLESLILWQGSIGEIEFNKARELPRLKEWWFCLQYPLKLFTDDEISPRQTNNPNTKPKSNPAFRTLTHLGFFSGSKFLGPFPAASFPNVTHIHFDAIWIRWVSSILDTCIHLKVLLVPGTQGVGVAPDAGFVDRGMDEIKKRFDRDKDKVELVNVVEYWITAENLKEYVMEKRLSSLWEEGEKIVNARRLVFSM